MDHCPCGCGLSVGSVDDIPWEGEWPQDCYQERLEQDQHCKFNCNSRIQFTANITLLNFIITDFQTLIAVLREHRLKSFWLQDQSRDEWEIDLDYTDDDQKITFTITHVPNQDTLDDVGLPVEEVQHPPVCLNLTTSKFEIGQYSYSTKTIPTELRFLPFRVLVSPMIKSAAKC